MKRKATTLFLCVLTIALIAASPFVLTSYFSEQTEPAAFKGILTLWHIEEWRTGGSSGLSYLQRRIYEFEKKHPHVFIETEKMTADEARDAAAQGVLPDIVSFPSGCDTGLLLSPIAAQKDAYISGTDGALAYMCGAYYVIVNTEMLDENATYVPDGWGIRPDELLAAAKYCIAFCAEPGYSSLPSLSMHAYPDVEGPEITTWPLPPPPDAMLSISPVQTDDALASFCSGELCVLVVSQHQLFKVETAYEQGEAPSYAAYALGGYTDMAQYIGVIETDDALRRSMCEAFAEYVTGHSAQKKLTALAVYPAVRGLEIYEDDDVRTQTYRILSEDIAFASPEQADMLGELAMRAMTGDKRALRLLRKALR